jgi:hypothetical protein
VKERLTTALGTCPPGACNKLETIGDWVTYVAAWGAGIAFVAAGAGLCFAYFSGHGSSRSMKALGGAAIGCVVISASAALTNALIS